MTDQDWQVLVGMARFWVMFLLIATPVIVAGYLLLHKRVEALIEQESRLEDE